MAYAFIWLNRGVDTKLGTIKKKLYVIDIVTLGFPTRLAFDFGIVYKPTAFDIYSIHP